MKATTRTDEEVIEEIVGKKMGDIDKKMDNVLAALKPKEKVSEALDKIDKTKPPEKIVKSGGNAEHGEHDVFCPTCGKGHVHKLGGSGLNLKCTGEGCGEEYVLVSKKADHKCTTCGLPIKKPTGGQKIEACPFCGNKRGIEFNLDELIKMDQYRKV